MLLRIRKGLFSWKLIDEGGKTVAQISSKKWIGPAKEICDEKGKHIFTTDIINLPPDQESYEGETPKKYVIYKNGKPIATASLRFAARFGRGKTPAYVLRPPQVNRMEVETPYGPWVVERQKNNGLTISRDGEQLGIVTPFFAFKPVCLNYTGKYEAAFWAAIYTLIEYMMHEDDLTVV